MACQHCDDLRVELAAVRTIVERMDHDLLGNGQPGKISQHEARLTCLEQWRAYMGGALAIISTISVSALAGALAAAFGWIKK